MATTVKRAWARVVSIFHKRGLDREFEEEVRSHIELATEDYLRRGRPPEEARRLARVKFGAMEASKDAHRDSRGLPWLEGFVYDLRFAVRGLRRDRAFAMTAVAMLALAMGLNVTVFAVVNTLLFRGFPLVKNNDRLVYIQEHSPLWCCRILPDDFEAWRTQAKSFDGIAWVSGTGITWSENGNAMERRGTTLISAGTFRMMGVQPILGRDFAPSDEMPGAAQVVLLNYRFWERHFGKDPGVIGRTVRINNEPATLIGVMPERFAFPEQGDLWMPVRREAGSGAVPSYMAMGRMAKGATVRGTRAELATIAQRRANASPSTNRDVAPKVETFSEFFIGPDARLIYGSMWAAAWFVLLIACANVANLALARTMRRARELSTRIALGAGRWRIVRQLLTESVMVAAAGGALAWWIVQWSVGTYAAATESQFQVLDYTIGSATLIYLAAISLVAGILFGIAPVASVLRFDVNSSLRGGSRWVTWGIQGKRLSGALVAGQMALAIVLLLGAGVLVRSFLKFYTADLGIDPRSVLAGVAYVDAAKYASTDARVRELDLLRSRLEAVPGVEAMSIASRRPVEGSATLAFELEGSEASGAERRPTVSTLTAGSEYFRVLRATLFSGREFRDTDGAKGIPVAIVNQRFAEKFLPGKDPLGRRLRLFRGETADAWVTVVGVVGNIVQDDRTRQEVEPLVYLSFRQEPAAEAWFFVRTRVAPESLAGAIRREMEKLKPDVNVTGFSTLEEALKFSPSSMDVAHRDTSKNAVLSPIFASIALLLASIGLYAAVAHSVSQRTKEIGVRMAIGAAAKDIWRLVFREGTWPVGVGLALGLAASLGVNRFLQSQLVGVSPYDPVTMVFGPVVLIVVALAGCQIPARRAMRVDPAVALRED